MAELLGFLGLAALAYVTNRRNTKYARRVFGLPDDDDAPGGL